MISWIAVALRQKPIMHTGASHSTAGIETGVESDLDMDGRTFFLVILVVLHLA